MQKDWLKAAERYEAAKQPGFKPRNKRPGPEKPLVTLASFMANGEGEAARKLLTASGRDICLGYSETVMSQTNSVVLDGEGLKTHSGVVGMAAAYSKEPPRRAPIDANEAIRLLESFPEEGNLHTERFDEEPLVNNIRKALDEIAKDAP